MKWSLLLLPVGAALAIAACNSDTFTGDDGGSDANGDSPIIGGGDGGKIEGGTEAAGPIRFCQTVDAQFCADFDTPNDAGAGFQATKETNGWTVAFDNTLVKSPPLALQSKTGGDAGGTAQLQVLAFSTATSAVTTQMHVEFDIYLPSNLPNTSAPLFAFTFGSVPSEPMMFGLAHEGPWMLERATGSGVYQLNPQPTTGEWAHAVMSITLSTTSGFVTLDLHGSTVTAHGELAVPTTFDGGTTWPGVLYLGATSAMWPNTDTSFQYDNVVVSWQ